MTGEILTALLAANLAGGAAILLVLAVRWLVLRHFGPRLAYRLWLAPPIAALAVFLPAPAWMSLALRLDIPRTAQTVLLIEGPATLSAHAIAPAAAATVLSNRLDVEGLLLAIWITGALAAALLTLLAHRRGMKRFGTLQPSGAPGILRAANHGLGPALVGILRPRLVLPADFEQRFEPREQALILEHERRHGRCGDVRINALVSLIGCINWFNPLVHLAATRLRLDQELACDAAVVERFPGERRTYGQALLKSQLAVLSLPLGCTWPSAPKRLQERLTMLAFPKPTRPRLMAGSALIAALCVCAAATAWAAAGATAPGETPVEVHLAQAAAKPIPAPSLAPAAAKPEAGTARQQPDPARVCISNSCMPPAETARPRDAGAVANAINAGDALGVINAGGSADEVVAAMKVSETLAGRYNPDPSADPSNTMPQIWDAIVPGSPKFVLTANGVPAVSWNVPKGVVAIRTIPGLDLAAPDAPQAAKVLYSAPSMMITPQGTMILPAGGVATLVVTPSPD